MFWNKHRCSVISDWNRIIMDGDATMSIYPIMKQEIVSEWNFALIVDDVKMCDIV